MDMWQIGVVNTGLLVALIVFVIVVYVQYAADTDAAKRRLEDLATALLDREAPLPALERVTSLIESPVAQEEPVSLAAPEAPKPAGRKPRRRPASARAD